jgi:predicted small metal-binding protein
MLKTMTCRQLGGPCGHSHRGDTADDVIRSQDEHLEMMVESGDDEHRQVKKDFAQMPEVV